MERIRMPFQGVYNIIRFNWHFYLIALAALTALLIISNSFSTPVQFTIRILCILLALSVSSSVFVSYYIYDASGFYEMNWLSSADLKTAKDLVNIHAGFDETSALIQEKFKDCSLQVFDFYDPKQHTEISIRRARAAYPAYPNTQNINTTQVPLPDSSVDVVFLIFAAHEIRQEKERVNFIRDISRTLRADGKIILIEHLRDVPNFAAFNIGFFHFYSKRIWLKVVEDAGLANVQIRPINPFVKLFVISKE
ncbi:class I SAM-dependent methyltransferase [Terrimonas sp. NA20]|uniref:Class I SAM-dependent methyltransferase n=1 Tax=Terrimonas ginsenosidimutans TaxID=2908004 RepID=A0ABS9KKJ6_9BACT|nr:methyltransferase domain-containing protein [Terrimonas ginsenosidimutans]MCG2612848.1 class I SAM-dependent methyltransferase [Terrimonas ginsenosidimutans]